MPNVVKKENLAEANVIFFSSWGVMAGIGAGIGGYLTTVISRNMLFAIDSLSFVLSALIVYSIKKNLSEDSEMDDPGPAKKTHEQIGYAFMPAFWGFTLAMILGGPLVDYIGLKKGMWAAFILHAIGIFLTLFAYDFSSLFLATVLMGFGNGMVEAVCNPMVASMYPEQKTKMLNRFHMWWPIGIVTGAFTGVILMDILGFDWQYMVASLFIPLLCYGFLFYGQDFPETELSKLGISQKHTLKNQYLIKLEKI